jgi:NTE family protein
MMSGGGRRRVIVSVLAACLLHAAAAQGADVASGDQPAVRDRLRIGLALSGGGARGAAHVGVLRALERMRVPVDYIAGASMGAVIGGLYAGGLSADEIEDALDAIDWESVFDDTPPRAQLSFRRKRDDDQFLVKAKPGLKDGEIQFPAGAVQGQKLDLILKRLTLRAAAIEDFDALPIPFRAVATDIVSGDPVVLGGGELSRAMRASMSIPALFEPVEVGGRLLVDGGVSMNLPIGVVRDMGADVVIAVDVSTPLRRRDQLDSPLAILDQLTNILVQRNTGDETHRLGPHDVLIVPDLADFSSLEFIRSGDAIGIGEQATQAHASVLSSLSVPVTEYADRTARRGRRNETPIVSFVRLENQSRLRDEAIRGYIDVETGAPLDLARLERSIERLYGLDYFKSVRYDVVRENGETGVVVRAEEKPWGPNYLQFGAETSGDLQGENRVNLSVSYLRTAINDLGGEWRTTLTLGEEPSVASEWYQPLDVARRYFIAPRIAYEIRNVDRFDDDGDALTRNRVTRYGLELAAGREFGTWGEARFGLRRLAGRSETDIGAPPRLSEEFDTGEAFVRLYADELDNFFFPRNGHLARVEYVVSRDAFGADADFEQILSAGNIAWSAGRNTLLGLARLNTTVAGVAPVQSRFRAGGFLNLSGFVQNQLSGQHYLSVAGVYFRRVGNFTVLPAYLGGSLEYGNVFEDESDIAVDDMLVAGSLFFGLDTFLGPLYFAYGHAEGGFQSGYAYLGRPF